MSSNPLVPSFRKVHVIPTNAAHSSVRQAINDNDKNITDLNQSIVAIRSQLTAAAQAAAAASSVTETVTTEEIAPSQWIGFGTVNDQSGVTSYTTLQSDDGALLILSDASPVAVTLSNLTMPFLLFAVNWGAGLVTFTPASGKISSIGNLAAASMTLAQGYSAMIVYDGTDFSAETLPVVPVDTPAVTHEWLKSYDASTGDFTQTQPVAADVTNAADVTAANTFALLQSFTAGIKIGSGSTFAELVFSLGVFLIEAVFAGVPVGFGLETSGTNSNATIQGSTAEVGYGAIAAVGGSTYASIAEVESNPANFLSSSNTVEYQIGSQKNGSPGTLPPTTFAVGDVDTAFKLPAIFLSTVTQPAPSVLTTAVTASSATAGAASSLPTTPLGYLEMSVNGTTVKIPYYSV